MTLVLFSCLALATREAIAAGHLSLVQHRAHASGTSESINSNLGDESLAHAQNLQRLHMDFSKAKVVDNNLGGRGPLTGPERIYYENVGTLGVKTFDLEVSVEKGEYSGNVSKNGVDGIFGEINIDGGTGVDLIFRFFVEGEPSVMPHVSLSFWDLDSGKKGGIESITVGPLVSYFATSDTEISAKWSDAASWNFTGTTAGTTDDNPTSFESLTELQTRRGVEVNGKMVSEMKVRFECSPNKWGRTFMFAGSSPLVFQDQTPVGKCKSAAKLDFSNLVSGTPQTGMMFDDVTILSDGTKVGAKLVASSSYEAANESKTGVRGGIVDVNINGNISSDFTLKFIDEDGAPVTLSSFFLSFLDIDSPEDGHEILKIAKDKYVKYYTFWTANFDHQNLDGITTFTSKRKGNELDNPTDKTSLTMSQLDAGVTFYFQGTSRVDFTYESENAPFGRNLMLTGVTTLACPRSNTVGA